ncbi:MAG: MarR family transcriptional regulator [Bryobacteraceae bacterium]|nr:MarR family transcriptional regulator [Bryobacteraceae bacterium]
MAATSSRLQREIRQTRPFRSVWHEAFLCVLKTADSFRRAVAALLEPHGITPQQYNVLRILRGAGGEAMPTLAIGERLIEETPGMTRLLDRLEAKRLIRRERCRQDRRQVLCRITPAGLRLLERLDPLITGPEQRLAGVWKAAEAKAVIGLLDRAREAMEVPPVRKGQKSSRGAKKG